MGHEAFGETVRLDLDTSGRLIDPATSSPVGSAALPHFLSRQLAVPEDATDINVFVHGWNTTPDRADHNAIQLIEVIAAQYQGANDRYPGLSRFKTYNVIVRWPSRGRYRSIRRRAHQMSTSGYASEVISQLLGYLNTQRRIPQTGPGVLQTAGGQYLHCIGHSFGGRFLCQAVQEVRPAGPPTLAWDWGSEEYPYTVDSLLIFQMAARPDIFASEFRPLLATSVINCPITLTFSSSDRATGLWHQLAEGKRGIGHVGARSPAEQIKTSPLRPISEDYSRDDLLARIVNINASRYFRRGRWSLPQGAHSDIVHPESAHLYLTLAALAR